MEKIKELHVWSADVENLYFERQWEVDEEWSRVLNSNKSLKSNWRNLTKRFKGKERSKDWKRNVILKSKGKWKGRNIRFENYREKNEEDRC